jgi:MFS family permease
MAQILSLVAQNLLNFSLIIRMFDLTQGTRYANISVALLILSFGIPSVLFAAAAGAYVDNWDRKRVLVVSNMLRTVLVLGYLLVDRNLIETLALTFLISTITQFFAPAESASIPRLVPRLYLVNANAMFISTFYATFVLGYSAAAPVISLFGAQSPFIFGSAMFGIATVLTLMLPKLGEGQVHHGTFLQLLDKTRRQLANSRRQILGSINLWVPIVQLMLIQIIVSVVLALAPALSIALLKRPLQDVSYFLIIPIAIGMIGGVIMVSPLSRRIQKLRLIKIGLLFAGGALLGLGLTGLLYRQINGHTIATTAHIGWIVAGLVFVLGFMNSIVSVSAQTLLHENSNDATRGKIFGALNTMINLAATLPVLAAGILADLFSPTEVVAATGLIVLGLALIQIWFIRTRFQGSDKSLDISGVTGAE